MRGQPRPRRAVPHRSGLLNLALFVPVGCFALLALRRPAPALLGVATLPCVIELGQATLPFVGRGCDSADVEMNVLGGLVGLLVAGAFLARRGRLDPKGWARPSLVVGACLAVAGAVVLRTVVTTVHYDGTGLSAPGRDQEDAVSQAVRRAFGDHFAVSRVYVQPCAGVRCTHLAFTVGNGGMGSLDWPAGDHLDIELDTGLVPGDNTYPVAGPATPHDAGDAGRVAETYMRDHYPWAARATVHRVVAAGPDAADGWLATWRFVDSGVEMPRTLDVEVNRAGHVSRIEVSEGPQRVAVPEPVIDEEEVRRIAAGHLWGTPGSEASVPAGAVLDAVAVRANNRGGGWRPEWMVTSLPPDDGEGEPSPTTLWVDAVDGTVHESAYPEAAP